MSRGTNLAKAYVQIIPSAEGIQGRITEALGGEAYSAGKSAGGSIASAIKRVIASAGIGQALKTAINEGAELQQSLGGIETLFKESSDKVIANAKKAYETAGVSANEYMQTVTSFSASLLQGLAGDTEKAANLADIALVDMSDNANKMGTSMELIQNAYQGFAKQNYTMLDNLKLGYGGTATEMARLINDSGVLGDALIDLSDTKGIGQALSEVGFAKTIEAIHIIQEKMGITGTTAKEAAETFSGSLSAMVSAGKNVLANLTLGEDIMPSLKALGETTFTFVKGNLFPMIGNVLEGIGTLLLENGDDMVTNGASMLTSFINGISSKLPELVPKALEMIVTMSDAIIDNLPVIADAGIELLKNLILGIVSELPTLIVEAPRIINEFAEAIYSMLGELILAGIEMIVSLVTGIWENRGLIIENAGEIFMAFLNVFSLSKLFSLGQSLVTNLKNGIANLGPNITAAGKELLHNMVSGIKSLATHPVTALKEIGTNALNAVKNFKWLDLGKNIILGIVKGIKQNIGSIISALTGAVQGAVDDVKDFLGIKSPSRLFQNEVGKMIDLGLAAGIENNVNAVSDSMKELSKATVGTIDTDFAISVGKIPEVKLSNIEDNKKIIVVHSHVEVDGREIARSTAEYIGEQLPWEDI